MTRDGGHHGAAGSVPAPLTVAQARTVTDGLRAAMDDVRRSVQVLAARVQAAHTVRVWTPLGYASWETYCAAEFGISRAQAYRLLDVARALAAIQAAVTAGTEVSLMRDTHPATATGLDYGLSQRALLAVSARADTVAELITRRLATLARDGLTAHDAATVRAVVRQAVRDVRTTPPPRPPAGPPADPNVAAARVIVDELAAVSHAIGELLLDVAPAYLSDTEAADILAPLCNEIGEDLDHGLAARRYALTGDRRALFGTVL
ncbi:hypothetical protein [Streptomyces sp. NPDC059491]|uniref:hypothetical protein n=1 Tax=Streptomyces sp. NPDC059491 TaxID=3346850 RepID=UPI0036CA2E5C